MIQAFGLILAVGTVIAAMLALRKSEWALVLVIGLYAIEQVLQAYFPALLARPWMINVAVGIVAIMAVSFRMTRREDVFLGYVNPVSIGILLLYMWECVTLIWSSGQVYAIESLIAGFPYLVIMIGVAPLLIRDLRQFRNWCVAFLIVGSVVTVMLLLNPKANFSGGRFGLELGNYAGEIRGNPLAIATLGGTLVIIAALVRFERGSTLLSLIRIGGFLAGMAIAIFSGSRGQVLAAALTAVLFYPFSRKVVDVRQFFVTAFGLVLLAGGIFLVFKLFIFADNEARWSVDSFASGTDTRLFFIWDLLSEYLSNPHLWVVGLGAGAFDSLIQGYVHNSIIEVLCELGVVGMVLFGLTILGCIRYGREMFAVYRNQPTLRSAAAVLCALTFFQFLLSLKQGSLIFSAGPLLMFVVLAKVGKTMQEDAIHDEAMLFDDESDENQYSDELFDSFDSGYDDLGHGYEYEVDYGN